MVFKSLSHEKENTLKRRSLIPTKSTAQFRKNGHTGPPVRGTFTIIRGSSGCINMCEAKHQRVAIDHLINKKSKS